MVLTLRKKSHDQKQRQVRELKSLTIAVRDDKYTQLVIREIASANLP